ncbi:MAG: helix-turn-helix domain-containing protein [Hydromonas sp.]|nr:helix-turn-helix domain-containing protein [Hydromonas sp.]
MSNDIPTDATQNIEIPKLTLGQWLMQARQAKNLSVQEVALRTNRSAMQISELEADNLSSFGAPVLLRGMVRQYTKVVGADEAQALGLIPEQFKVTRQLNELGFKDSQVTTPKAVPMGKPWISQIWIVLLTTLVLALLAYWVFGARMFKDKDAAQKMSTANQIQIANPPAPAVTAPAVAPTPETTATPTATVSPAAEQTTASAVADVALGLKFKGAVWIEIKDAKGTVLVSGTQAANSEQNIKGELPLSVIIGDVTNVDMTWKGQPYDLKSATKGRGTVAKIERLE